MRILTAALLLLAASGAAADCARPGAAPPIPNGAKSDEAAMKEGHDAIQAYVHELEAYKACLKQEADTAKDVSQEQAMVWLAQGDAAVDSASYLAAQYSAALKVFKEHQSQTSK